MPRPKLYSDDLRARLIARAGERLAEHGPHDLSLRTLAAAEGTSTNAIYTIFGGKAQLIGAVLAEAGSSFLDAQLQALGAGDRLEDLTQLGLAYRAWALDHPTFYCVMFGGSVPPGPGGATGAHADGAAPLRDAVAQLMDAGLLRPASVDLVCQSLWASVHGWVMLEIGGLDTLTAQPEPDAREAAYRAHLEQGLVGLASDTARPALLG